MYFLFKNQIFQNLRNERSFETISSDPNNNCEPIEIIGRCLKSARILAPDNPEELSQASKLDLTANEVSYWRYFLKPKRKGHD
jgi:hypothetical protein